MGFSYDWSWNINIKKTKNIDPGETVFDLCSRTHRLVETHCSYNSIGGV